MSEIYNIDEILDRPYAEISIKQWLNKYSQSGILPHIPKSKRFILPINQIQYPEDIDVSLQIVAMIRTMKKKGLTGIHEISKQDSSQGIMLGYGFSTSDDSNSDFEQKGQQSLLENLIYGYFPGSKFGHKIEYDKKIIEDDFNHRYVGMIIGTPSLQLDETGHTNSKKKSSWQNIARLLQALNQLSSYRIIQLFEPLAKRNIYEELTTINKFRTHIEKCSNIQINIGESSAINYSKTQTFSFNNSTSITSDKQQRAKATNEGQSEQGGFNNAINKGISYTDYKFEYDPIKERLEKVALKFNSGLYGGLWRNMTFIFADTRDDLHLLYQVYSGLYTGNQSPTQSFQLIELFEPKDEITDKYYFLKHILLGSLLISDEDYTSKIQTNDISISDIPTQTQFIVGHPFYSVLSTEELALIAGLPDQSVPGIAVKKRVDFAVEPIDLQKSKNIKIKIGNCISRGIESEKQPVEILVDSFSRHAFITGTTGSGKSTCLTNILKQAYTEHKVPFMVMEPAKPEYHLSLKGLSNLRTLIAGSNDFNKNFSLNPFEFPEGIDPSQHIDYLSTVFSSALNLYYAMPYYLTDSLYDMYEELGWFNGNFYDPDCFPSMPDLSFYLENRLKKEKLQGEYGANIQSALLARIRSLRRGIKSRIFDPDIQGFTDFSKLLEHPATLDFSNIGDDGERALLMGLVFLRLKEIRSTQANQNKISQNSELNHILVLEEAHQLFANNKSSGEGQANKSSSAITLFNNMLAEMRTYGQGIIIADQSPSSVESSVVKNTNIKIAFRLPDIDDRKTIGLAIGLSDEQIKEIFHLSTGESLLHYDNLLLPVLIKTLKPLKIDNREENGKKYKKNDLLLPVFRKNRHNIFNAEFSDWDNWNIRYWPGKNREIEYKIISTPITKQVLFRSIGYIHAFTKNTEKFDESHPYYPIFKLYNMIGNHHKSLLKTVLSRNNKILEQLQNKDFSDIYLSQFIYDFFNIKFKQYPAIV